MSRTFACFSTTYKASAPVVVVHSAQLDRKLMAARVAVAHEVLGAGIDILLPQLGTPEKVKSTAAQLVSVIESR
jgi:hypothetical protein